MENWYCIYTKPRHEEMVCKQLNELCDIETFNPKLKTIRNVRSKPKECTECLFPSYIFSRFDPYQYYHMLKYTRGVKRVVGNSLGLPYIIEDRIIQLIRLKMKDGYIHLQPDKLLQGDKVRVIEGPLSGLTGLFLTDLKPNERVMILLNTIQYPARVEIPRSLIART